MAKKQDELTELECKLLCLNRIALTAMQKLVKLLSIQTDVAKGARATTPGNALSAILQSLPHQRLSTLRSLSWPDNREKFYDDQSSKNKFKTDIDCNILDITPISQLLLKVPAYGTCPDPYIPLDYTTIKHSGAGVICTNNFACCAFCLKCDSCNRKCDISNIDINLITNLRNTNSHYAPVCFQKIDNIMKADPDCAESTDWLKKLENWKDAILKILKAIPCMNIQDQKEFERNELKLRNILEFSKDVYIPCCIPNGFIHVERQKQIYINSIELYFDATTKWFSNLKEFEKVNSPESIALQDYFELQAQKILKDNMQLDDDNKDLCEIRLSGMVFERFKKSIYKVKTVIHLESYKDVVPKCYKSIRSVESRKLCDDFTRTIKERLSTLMNRNVSVKCNGYEFASIHLHFDIIPGKVESVTDDDIVKIKDAVENIVIGNTIAQILRTNNLNDFHISVSFPIDESVERLAVRFKLFTYAEDYHDKIEQKLPYIRDEIDDRISQIKEEDLKTITNVNEDMLIQATESTVETKENNQHEETKSVQSRYSANRPSIQGHRQSSLSDTGRYAFEDMKELIKKGNVNVLKEILDDDPSTIRLRSNTCSFTPLIYASFFNKLEIVSLLVKHNADLSAVNNEGRNAFHECVWHGNVDVLKYLLEVDSSFIDRVDQNNWTPLDRASWKGKTECVRLLLSYHNDNADVETAYSIACEGYFLDDKEERQEEIRQLIATFTKAK